MKKMIIYTFIVILLLVVLAFVAFEKKYGKQPAVSGVVRASLSFGSEMIEFDYPTFKGWDVVLNNDNSILHSPIKSNIFRILPTQPSTSITWKVKDFLVAPKWEQFNTQGVGYKILGFDSIMFDDGRGGAYQMTFEPIHSAPSSIPTKLVLEKIKDTFRINPIKKSSSIINIRDNENSGYGEIKKYKTGQSIEYPDFILLHTGVTSTKVDFNPNLKFTYYNFDIKTQDGKVGKISWSSGTGIISPEFFVANNKMYRLELAHSDILKKLASNELVVSVETEYSIQDYLLTSLMARLTLLNNSTVDQTGKILGFTFEKSEAPNSYTDIYTSPGFSFISSAELRISKNNEKNKLLILKIDPTVGIIEKMILDEYPEAELVVNAPENPIKKSLKVSRDQNMVSFGVDELGRLINISIDTNLK